MSSYSSDASRSGERSPLFGTSSYSTLTPSESAQTRYSHSSRSGETASFLLFIIFDAQYLNEPRYYHLF